MLFENLNFFSQITQHQSGRVELGPMLVSLNQLIPKTTKLLKINMDRYRMVPIVDAAIPNSADFALVYQTVCDIFPAFPFVVSSQLQSQPNHAMMGRQLQIAGIGSSLAQHHTQPSQIVYFLRSIDLSVNLLKSASKTTAQTFSYLPKLIKGDLILIARNLEWEPSQKPLEMIENLYCMQGLAQIFLRYYFNLIAAAETDQIAQYVDDIFLNFFISLHYRELQYWQSYPNAKKVKTQLQQIIDQNAFASRHPVLKKEYFDQINDFHPLIHHEGEARQMTSTVKNLLDQQLEAFQAFSLKKMALLLRILSVVKEPAHLRYFLLQIAKTNPRKLFQLKDFLQSSFEGSSNFPDLIPVLDPILHKVALPQTIIQKNIIFRKIEAVGIFSDFDLLSQLTRNRIFQAFEHFVSSWNPIQKDQASLEKEDIYSYLKLKKITSSSEVETYTQLIQGLLSIDEHEQTKLINDLRQIKMAEINKEAFEKVKIFVSSINLQPLDIKEKLLKKFDHESQRITEVLGKEKLIAPSDETLKMLAQILASTTEEKSHLLRLFSLIFSLPIITRPATLDHFLRIINQPELINSHIGKRERDLHLRNAVDRSLQHKRLKTKMSEIRGKVPKTTSSLDKKTRRQTPVEKNALKSEFIKHHVSSEDFVNKYLFSNVWIAETIERAESTYRGQFLIAFQLNEMIHSYRDETLTFPELQEGQQKILREIHQRKGQTFKDLLELFNTMGTKDPYRFVSKEVTQTKKITKGLLILGLKMTRFEDQFGLHIEFRPALVRQFKL